MLTHVRSAADLIMIIKENTILSQEEKPQNNCRIEFDGNCWKSIWLVQQSTIQQTNCWWVAASCVKIITLLIPSCLLLLCFYLSSPSGVQEGSREGGGELSHFTTMITTRIGTSLCYTGYDKQLSCNISQTSQTKKNRLTFILKCYVWRGLA